VIHGYQSFGRTSDRYEGDRLTARDTAQAAAVARTPLIQPSAVRRAGEMHNCGVCPVQAQCGAAVRQRRPLLRDCEVTIGRGRITLEVRK
jgi:hypothetical protein